MYIKKLLIAVLLGILLVVGLTGEVGAREKSEVNAYDIVTIPAAFFRPADDRCEWNNKGYAIEASGAQCSFFAPVVFPGSGPVKVRKMVMYVYDNSTWNRVRATLYRTNPGPEHLYAEKVFRKSTPWVAWKSTVDPFVFTDTDPESSNPDFYRGHGAHVRLDFLDRGHNLRFYGVKIFYE